MSLDFESAVFGQELPETPSEKELERLNQEYSLWRNIVGIAFVVSILLYIMPTFLKLYQ